MSVQITLIIDLISRLVGCVAQW